MPRLFSRLVLCIVVITTPTKLFSDPIIISLTLAQFAGLVALIPLAGIASSGVLAPAPPPAPPVTMTGTQIISTAPIAIQAGTITQSPVKPPPPPQAVAPRPVAKTPVPSLTASPYWPSWKAVLLTSYIIAQARLYYLFSYLSQPGLPSSLFKAYTLNELLLMPPETVHTALRDYLFDTYAIRNQQELKMGITRFLHDVDAEISLATEYKRYCTIGAHIGAAHHYINSSLQWILSVTIPVIGPLASKIPLPTIDQLFFLRHHLNEELSERLSKLLFLKTTFLHMPLTV